MDELLERILQTCRVKGVKQKDLANALGLLHSNISLWKQGKSNSYRRYLPEIAEYLGVTVAYLVGEEINLPDNITGLPKTKKVPLLGDIACGEPILAIENVVDFVNVPFDINADMALVCKGDSMINARIFDGDVVYIRQQEDVENGEIAAVLVGDEATLKRVHKFPNRIVLSACNPLYDDMVFADERAAEVHIIGKAVAFTSMVR